MEVNKDDTALAKGPDTDLEVQMILLAASQHDLDSLRTLLRTGSANVQDPETGYTPLHAAIAACAPEEDRPSATEREGHTNGHVNGKTNGGLANGDVEDAEEVHEMELAIKTLKLLFQNGAIWNDLDKNNETPGCIAWRLGLRDLYEIMVDAGVRAELLLNRLDGYQALADDDDEEEDAVGDLASRKNAEVPQEQTQIALDQSESGTLPTEEATAISTEGQAQPDVNSADYLRSNLTYTPDRLLDSSANGVMMSWETPIMSRSADLLVPREGLRVLNIGHGLGIIDTLLQQKSPHTHHIVEAHPDVLRRAMDTNNPNSWLCTHGKKGNVIVFQATWQEVLPRLVEEGKMYDAIYFDTFAEDYKAFREFFSEYVIALLDEGGKWGFFNGLGADRQVCYDVYGKVVEMDLFEAGFDVEWETIDVDNLEEKGEWKGVRRPYWKLDKYKLPICTFVG